MRYCKPYVLLLVATIISGCHNLKKDVPEFPELTMVDEKQDNSDRRPKEEIAFLNRVKAESDYDIHSNAAQKDMHINAFNKYALDSLKNITDWEMIVTDVNDNTMEATSVAKLILGGDIYNLKLVAPIKIDHSADTIAIDNRVDFTLTIPKTPKGDTIKKQLLVVQKLKAGDTVVVSGSLTHLDDKGKVNFASFYDRYLPWDIDLLQTKIRKKGDK